MDILNALGIGSDAGEQTGVAAQSGYDRRWQQAQKGIASLDEAIADRFDDDYYRTVAMQATQALMPELQQKQVNDNAKALFSLARRGLGGNGRDSNTGQRLNANLGVHQAKENLALATNVDNIVNTRRSAIEQARNKVAAQLRGAAGTTAELAGNLAGVASKHMAPTMSPIGAMFDIGGKAYDTYATLKEARERTPEYINTMMKAQGKDTIGAVK